MTDADKVMYLQHFGTDPAVIRIRIGIPDYFWLEILALVEVCAH